MSETSLPIVYLARHGETAWSLSGQHTGLTDIPLTEHGEQNALRLRSRLAHLTVAHVLTSPLVRARKTCELAGYGAVAEVDADLVEWNYGDYEGLRSVEIHSSRPDWRLFRDGCPGGELPADVRIRADRFIERVRAIRGDVLVFSSGHILRAIAARWLELDITVGERFFLDTASVSALGYERTLAQPVVRLWNDVAHVDR